MDVFACDWILISEADAQLKNLKSAECLKFSGISHVKSCSGGILGSQGELAPSLDIPCTGKQKRWAVASKIGLNISEKLENDQTQQKPTTTVPSGCLAQENSTECWGNLSVNLKFILR